MKIRNFLFNFFMGVTLICAQDYANRYEKKVFKTGSNELNYRILYPKDFQPNQKYPLVLFLHGAGERGSDNEIQLVHGGALFSSAKNLAQFPAIVIFPQCPTEDYWANVEIDRNAKPFGIVFSQNVPPTQSLQGVMELLKDFLQKPFVDNQRIYVGGLSMGGMGTYELVSRLPQTFAAAFVICGARNTETVEKWATQTPVWIFHGAQDDIVNPLYAIQMGIQLIKLGASPNLSIYSFANHNSWDSAFQEPNLLPWLFSHIKTKL